MTISIVQLFRDNGNIELFKEAVIELNGAFPFGRSEMIAMCDLYSQRYPDSAEGLNYDNIQIGYKVVRICIIEKIIQHINDNTKSFYRNLFGNLSSIDSSMSLLIGDIGIDKVTEQYNIITRDLEKIKSRIQTLPIGVAKERFIVGLSFVLNVVYLINMAIDDYISLS